MNNLKLRKIIEKIVNNNEPAIPVIWSAQTGLLTSRSSGVNFINFYYTRTAKNVKVGPRRESEKFSRWQTNSVKMYILVLMISKDQLHNHKYCERQLSSVDSCRRHLAH